MKTNFKRPFARYVKKAHKPLQLAIEDEVDVVCDDPEIGELKVGDLAGIRVHKFRFSRQEYLIAYRAPKDDVPVEFLVIDFYQVGAHENFYAELKQYLIKFFSLLTNQAFRDDDFTHEQVFGHLQHEPLSAFEAAEYLEVSLPTLRRYVQANKLRPCHTVGRNQMFSAEDLRVYKRARR